MTNRRPEFVERFITDERFTEETQKRWKQNKMDRNGSNAPTNIIFVLVVAGAFLFALTLSPTQPDNEGLVSDKTSEWSLVDGDLFHSGYIFEMDNITQVNVTDEDYYAYEIGETYSYADAQIMVNSTGTVPPEEDVVFEFGAPQLLLIVGAMLLGMWMVSIITRYKSDNYLKGNQSNFRRLMDEEKESDEEYELGTVPEGHEVEWEMNSPDYKLDSQPKVSVTEVKPDIMDTMTDPDLGRKMKSILKATYGEDTDVSLEFTCPACNKCVELDDDDNFCPSCGFEIIEEG